MHAYGRLCLRIRSGSCERGDGPIVGRIDETLIADREFPDGPTDFAADFVGRQTDDF